MISLSILESPGEGFAADISNALRSSGVRIFINEAVTAHSDVLVVSPKFRGSVTAKCSAVLAPDLSSVNVPDGVNLVTYGMSPRATLTLSAVGDAPMLSVQREITTPLGTVEEQELPVQSTRNVDSTIAAAGASLMLGIEM